MFRKNVLFKDFVVVSCFIQFFDVFVDASCSIFSIFNQNLTKLSQMVNLTHTYDLKF